MKSVSNVLTFFHLDAVGPKSQALGHRCPRRLGLTRRHEVAFQSHRRGAPPQPEAQSASLQGRRLIFHLMIVVAGFQVKVGNTKLIMKMTIPLCMTDRTGQERPPTASTATVKSQSWVRCSGRGGSTRTKTAKICSDTTSTAARSQTCSPSPRSQCPLQ